MRDGIRIYIDIGHDPSFGKALGRNLDGMGASSTKMSKEKIWLIGISKTLSINCSSKGLNLIVFILNDVLTRGRV